LHIITTNGDIVLRLFFNIKINFKEVEKRRVEAVKYTSLGIRGVEALNLLLGE